MASTRQLLASIEHCRWASAQLAGASRLLAVETDFSPEVNYHVSEQVGER